MKKNRYKEFLNWLPIYLILETYKNWRNDRTLRLGAGISYYGVFAVVPLLTIMFSVAALFFSSESVTSYLYNFANRLFGNELSGATSQIVDKISTEHATSILTSTGIFGFLALIISASFIFVAFQDALDSIWHNPVRLGLDKWIKKYALSYLVVMVVSLLLFAVILITSMGSFIESNFPLQFKSLDVLTNVATRVAIGLVGIGFLTLFYRLLIFEKVKWAILFISSVLTSVLMVVGAVLLGLYISRFSGTSLSGAIGTVMVVLVWIYYESQIVLVGAQFIKTLQKKYK